ncbi:MAG: leucyl/phenylalanyl-tRNA--protein transferase [bacterium]
MPPRGSQPHKSTPILLAAFAHGAFQLACSRHCRVEVYTAPARSILPLTEGAFHAPRSLRQVFTSGRFVITTDACFSRVITHCANATRAESGTWINDWIIDAYTHLHHAGHAHSLEAWLPKVDAPTHAATLPNDATHTLVGGLYGVHLGAAFFGESMFSLPTLGGSNASKVCLLHLWHHLRARGFDLLDTQLANPHMQQFGIVEIPHEHFLPILNAATAKQTTWSTAHPGPTLLQYHRP